MNPILLWNAQGFPKQDPFEQAIDGFILTIIMSIVLIFFLAFVIGLVTARQEVTNHWSHLIPKLSYSTKSLYEQMRDKLLNEGIEGVSIWSKKRATGGMFSVQRHYLYVSWKGCNYEVCGSPFGHSFFISYRSFEQPNYLMHGLSKLPWIGKSFTNLKTNKTFYQHDTEMMFQKIFHTVVMNVIEDISKTHDMPKLSEQERTPSTRDLFVR